MSGIYFFSVFFNKVKRGGRGKGEAHRGSTLKVLAKKLMSSCTVGVIGDGWGWRDLLNAHQSDHFAKENPSARNVLKLQNNHNRHYPTGIYAAQHRSIVSNYFRSNSKSDIFTFILDHFLNICFSHGYGQSSKKKKKKKLSQFFKIIFMYIKVSQWAHSVTCRLFRLRLCFLLFQFLLLRAIFHNLFYFLQNLALFLPGLLSALIYLYINNKIYTQYDNVPYYFCPDGQNFCNLIKRYVRDTREAYAQPKQWNERRSKWFSQEKQNVNRKWNKAKQQENRSKRQFEPFLLQHK